MNWAQLMRDGLLMAAIFYSFAAAAAALQPQRAAAGPEESPRSMRRAACHKCVFCMPALPVLYGAARLANAAMADLLPASLLQWAVVALCGIAAAAAPPYGHLRTHIGSAKKSSASPSSAWPPACCKAVWNG